MLVNMYNFSYILLLWLNSFRLMGRNLIRRMGLGGNALWGLILVHLSHIVMGISSTFVLVALRFCSSGALLLQGATMMKQISLPN